MEARGGRDAMALRGHRLARRHASKGCRDACETIGDCDSEVSFFALRRVARQQPASIMHSTECQPTGHSTF
jgi:hypothetical protein